MLCPAFAAQHGSFYAPRDCYWGRHCQRGWSTQHKALRNALGRRFLLRCLSRCCVAGPACGAAAHGSSTVTVEPAVAAPASAASRADRCKYSAAHVGGGISAVGKSPRSTSQQAFLALLLTSFLSDTERHVPAKRLMEFYSILLSICICRARAQLLTAGADGQTYLVCV